jgi:hypothetical protein
VNQPGGYRRHVVMAAAELPVQADADVVVIGGSLRGIGAALAATRSGRSAVVAEPSTYLGHEITHCGRWWLPAAALHGLDSDVRDVLLDGAGPPDPAGEVGLWPDGVKRGLENLLLAGGVRILYGCHPVTEHGAAGRRAVVVATKAGRRVLRGDVVVRPPDPPAAPYALWHTLELTGVKGPLPARIPVPATLKLLGDAVYPHRGYLGDEHAVIEYGARARTHGDPAWLLRRLGIELLEHLVTGHAQLSGAWLAATAEQPLAGPGPLPPVLEPAALLAEGTAALRTPASGAPSEPATMERSMRVPGLRVAEVQARRPGQPLARQAVPDTAIPVLEQVEVAVVGAGTSGASAAAAAAGEGADTLVADANPGFGGTGTFGAVDSYWYGQRSGLMEDARAQTQWLHKRLGQSATRSRWNVAAKAHALQAMVAERGARVLTSSFAAAALMDGDRVAGVVLCTPHGLGAVVADVVVDATGDADVAALAGAETRYGAERTHSTMWCSLAQFVEPGRSRNNFGGIVDVADVADYTRAVLTARRRGGRLHDHGTYLASRETRTIVGRVTMTLTDQLTGRHWPDVVNVHYANHDIKGKSESIWTLMGLIPPNLEIEVPLRALLPHNLDGILVVGKAISVTHDGLAAVRMQADQENLGGVAGLLAARCARGGETPGTADVAAFQDDLTSRGLLPERLRGQPPGPRWQVPANATPHALVDRLLAEIPLHRYSDAGMATVHRDGIPFVELTVRRDLPVDGRLRAALDSRDPARRQVAAQVLTCRGRREGIDALVDELTGMLAGDGPLPARTAEIRHVQLPPDQAAMPAAAYLLYTLGLARDPRAVAIWQRVVNRVDTSEEALRDMYAGTFAYVDAVCFGAERLADPTAVPLLLDLHHRPALRDQHHEHGLDEDVFDERKAMLELAIGRALAHCGAPAGHAILRHYLRDNRAPLARAAHSALTLLLGQDLGDDPSSWDAAAARRPVAPVPLPERYDLGAPDGAILFDYAD